MSFLDERLRFTLFDVNTLEANNSFDLTDKGIVYNTTVILSHAGRVFFAGGSWIEEEGPHFISSFTEFKIKEKEDYDLI